MPRGRKKSSTAQASAADEDEDELASSTSSKRATPLHSIEQDTPSKSVETPYTNLRQLAGIIQKPSTPAARASSDDNTRATRLSALRQSSLKRPPRPVPAKKGAPTTPHAIRALQQRKNAALTPGGNRRRSGRQQRETPRDILRNLSRALVANGPSQSARSAKSSIRRSSSRLNDQESSESDELNDEIPKPRLSLPIDDEDDGFHAPPRLSLPLQDDDNTQTSIEAPRRAFPSDDLTRMSRASMRMSDRFGDISGLEDGEFQIDVPVHEQVAMDQDVAPQRSFLEQSSELNDPDNLPLQEFGQQGPDDSFAFDVPVLPSSDHGVFEEEPLEELSSEADDASEDRPEEESGDEPLEVPPDVSMGDDQLPDVEEHRLLHEAAGMPSHDDLRPGAAGRRKKELKQSRHGITYPPLPSSMIKKIVKSTSASAGGGKMKFNKDVLAALTQASDWFFEQLSEDLGAFADHAKHKAIDESDVVTLMRRQRLVTASTTPFSLAQRTLPSELLQAVRMMPPEPPSKARRKRLETVAEEGSDDEG